MCRSECNAFPGTPRRPQGGKATLSSKLLIRRRAEKSRKTEQGDRKSGQTESKKD
jgi:hypothetical protein